ncbi:MAG: hypothetical protein ACI8ZN_002649 [Bacteroidia bacterium]
MALKVNDFSNNGLNDISFKGKIVLIKGQTENGDWFDSETLNGKEVTYSVVNPFKKIPVEFVFLYDKESGHFKANKRYSKTYELGN